MTVSFQTSQSGLGGGWVGGGGGGGGLRGKGVHWKRFMQNHS